MATIPDLTDTATWPDEDLIALYRACLTEQERRRRLIDLPAQAAQYAAQYEADSAVGAPSVTALADVPVGGVIGPGGHLTTADGTEWENVSGAFLSPHTAGPDAHPQSWRRAGDSAVDPATLPSWESGVAYTTGTKVTHQGVAYTCLQGHTSQAGWEPPAVPALWSLA